MANLPWRISMRLMVLAKKIALVIGVVLIVLLAIRIYASQKGPALHVWHTWTADEMSVAEIDHASFAQYLTRENAIFTDLRSQVTDKTEESERTPLNRFYRHSLVWPGQFSPDANRSFVLMPTGKPRGAVVLLHGLTDSPYSVRHLAVDYQQRGFVAVAPRLPGHGTAPGALTDVDWETWLAVTRLAVREATRLAGDNVPLHLVGYSNGGALAMKYALDSLDSTQLRKPQQLVLLSPMIGVTAFARFAGIGIGGHKIAVNLLPMSLVNVPGAVEFLVDQIKLHGLQPEQVVIEVTENEMISGFNQFNSAIKQLRAEGIGLAIDDFGSGYAGLSLLTRFQPDKIKIDREIVSNIHLSGPKQAIVKSIVSCCTDMEISLVAEGIEKIEEWCWLESAGIRRFQGFLFARPQLNGVGDIHWPRVAC